MVWHWAVGKTLKEIKLEGLFWNLHYYDWNRTLTAKKMQMSVRTIRTMLKELRAEGYKIETPRGVSRVTNKKT